MRHLKCVPTVRVVSVKRHTEIDKLDRERMHIQHDVV